MNKSNRTPLTDALLPRVRPMALEQRFMFDAAAASIATDPQHTLDAQHTDTSAADSLAKFAVAATVSVPVEVRAVEPALNNGRKEVAFIDTGVADYQTLVDGIRAGVEVVLLDAGQDGLAQMALWAQSHSGYDAIHVLSHGSDASIQLGQFQLSNANLNTSQVQSELLSLGQALTVTGDLLIYGCDVAQDSNGRAFVNALATVTARDVAASVDPTGKGGNWSLEYFTGNIDFITSYSLSLPSYQYSLAAFIENFAWSGLANGDYVRNSSQTPQYYDFTVSGVAYRLTTYINGDGVAVRWWSQYGDSNSSSLSVDSGATQNIINTGTIEKISIARVDGSAWILNSIWIDPATYSTSSTNMIASLSGSTVSTQTVSAGANPAVYSFNVTLDTLTISSADFEYFAIDKLIGNTTAATGPTVTDGKISISSSPSGSNTTYKIGDTVTASWNNTAIGDNQSGITGVTMDFSQFGGGTAVTASDSSGTWTASYTITAGSVDATTRNVSVTATSSSGSTTTADTSNLSVDNIAPTVTDARISISGGSGTSGAFKIGDTVTATWNNTGSGDNNTDTISSVTADFSQFGGGSAVTATNSSGSWSASHSAQLTMLATPQPEPIQATP